MAVDIGRINADARDIQFRRVFLTVLASIFYSLGWTARKVFVVARMVLATLWLAAAWSWAAVKLGWTEAAPKPKR